MKHLRTVAVLFPLVLLSLACSSIKQPTASIKGMNVTDVTATGFTMLFDVEGRNPNSVDLPVSNADYKLSIGGATVADGKVKPTGVIPANGSLAVKFPLRLSYENLMAAEQTIVKRGGNVPYSLTGNLKFSGGAGNVVNDVMGGISVPVMYDGTLDVKSLVQNPQALMNSPAAKKLASQLVSGLLTH